MRKTMFGDQIIESTDDDLGSVEAFQEAGGEIYAVIREDEEGSGMYDFEVMENESGEVVVSSDPIFKTQEEARDYLRQYVSDIQED